MNETLLQIARVQELMTWVLVFVATLDFLGLMVAAWCLYMVRGTRDMVRGTRDMVARVDERSERLNYYLFSKLGPTDLK